MLWQSPPSGGWVGRVKRPATEAGAWWESRVRGRPWRGCTRPLRGRVHADRHTLVGETGGIVVASWADPKLGDTATLRANSTIPSPTTAPSMHAVRAEKAAAGGRICLMTAKELLRKELPRWSEDDAEIARRAVLRRHESEKRRREVDAAIVESYSQTPQEDLGARWAARESIREEPWDRRT